MLRRSSWTCLPLLLTSAFLGGCGNQEKEPGPVGSSERLKGAAQQLANDPSASPTARNIANAALERTKLNADLDSFAKGQ